MTKMRVHQVAKDLGLASKDVIAALKELDIEVKSHMSMLGEEEATKVLEYLTRDKPAQEEAKKAPKEKDADEEKSEKKKPASRTKSSHKKASGKKKGAKKAKKQTVKDSAPAQAEEETKKEQEVISIKGPLNVKDLSAKMDLNPAQVLKKLIGMGLMISINQEVDEETAERIASEFDFQVERPEEKNLDGELEKAVAESFSEGDDSDKEIEPEPRSPVVTVMGHVDHGKTSLLDVIREENVTSQEAGGITQHIGAYQVLLDKERIVFLDTPGHEAFTQMRARGAQATDVAILVVAADDGIMPQTVEAIDHAKAAGVPIIVAINKIDRPNADPERVKQQLTEHGLVPEEWGGDTVCVPVSAKEKTGIGHLLEMILLVAEIQDLQAISNRPAKGIIVEAELDKGMGPVGTVLIKSGTLRVGDGIIAGTTYGRVRAMVDDQGNRVQEAGPSTPVAVLGLSDVPQAGDMLFAVGDDKIARSLAEKRAEKKREDQHARTSKVTLDNLYSQIQEGEVKELNIIVKADVQGSVEAVRQSFEKLDTEKVRINVIHGGVGSITESDVMLAAASNAIITGFNVRPETKSKRLAEEENIDIRTYRIIYDAINDVEAAMEGMLDPELHEVVMGRAEVREIFKVPKAGTVAGSYVQDGKITRDSKLRLIRDGKVIHEGQIDSLRRFKDDVREVQSGYEFGISIERFNDIKEGDIIEAYKIEEVK